MRQAALGRLNQASMVIMAAAVSDYRVETATRKLKREGSRTLQLEPTKDILHEIVQRRSAGTLVIGFAAETEDLLANGRAKLARKGADALVLNDVSGSQTGFDSDDNSGWFLTSEDTTELPFGSKTDMAARILSEALRLKSTRSHALASQS
jgi:phosphopantothenoylcysteine decarboxylase/phosphopantothenate--cysteine ligase